MPDLKMKLGDGTVSSSVRILRQHVGVTAIDLWEDTDHNGAPDRFLQRIKQPNQSENTLFDLGQPSDLQGKVIQWIWMPSLAPDASGGWEVELDVRQNGKSLAGMPMRLTGDYAPGQRYGLFETWFRLVGAT